jgi:hypothetical protein
MRTNFDGPRRNTTATRASLATIANRRVVDEVRGFGFFTGTAIAVV